MARASKEDKVRREAQDADAPDNVETVYAKEGSVPVSVDSMTVDSKAVEAAEDSTDESKEGEK